MTSITVQDQINARTAEFSLVIDWRDGIPMRLSNLIRERVIMEWERQEAQGDARRPLVDVAAVRNAATRLGTDEASCRPTCMTCEQAVALALNGFSRNAYFVIVDGTQITDLDAEIRISSTTVVTFVRLVPLVGG